MREVTESYSAFDFVREAKTAIEDITARGKLPIIAGGTGLYIQSLLEGYHLGGEVPHEEILAYRGQLDVLSDEDLYQRVAEQGLVIPQLNRRRAMRALEIAHFGQDLANEETDFEPYLICLDDERSLIYDRINRRVDRMLEEGLLDEARWLYDDHPEAQAAKGIGYKELFPYFAGDIGLEEAVEKIKQNTRRFAKRQLTWFKNRMAVSFYSVSDSDYKGKINQAVADFLRN